MQVADRFHLLQNLAETLEPVFTTHARDLRAVEQARHHAVIVIAEGGPVRVAPLPPPTRALALAAERRTCRLARHEQVWALYRQGWPGEEIAQHLGVGRATVCRYLRTEVFPERKGRGDAGYSLLDPWRDVVMEHWTMGRRDGHRLFLELQRRGFRGSYTTLVRYLRRLREAHGAVRAYRPRRRPGPPLAVAPGRRRVLTTRTVAWTVLRRAEKRSPEDQTLLGDLRRNAPALDDGRAR